MAHEWTNGETITAEKLNDIENNIESQQNASNTIVLVTTTMDNGLTYSDVSMTPTEIREDYQHGVYFFITDETPNMDIYAHLYEQWQYNDVTGNIEIPTASGGYFYVDAEGHVTFTGK